VIRYDPLLRAKMIGAEMCWRSDAEQGQGDVGRIGWHCMYGYSLN
jgi:hypothetical protein